MCVYVYICIIFVCVLMCVLYCKIERKGGEPNNDDGYYYLSVFLHNRKQCRIYTQKYLKTHKHIL